MALGKDILTYPLVGMAVAVVNVKVYVASPPVRVDPEWVAVRSVIDPATKFYEKYTVSVMVSTVYVLLFITFYEYRVIDVLTGDSIYPGFSPFDK